MSNATANRIRRKPVPATPSIATQPFAATSLKNRGVEFRSTYRWSLIYGTSAANIDVHQTCQTIERQVFRDDLDYDADLWINEYPWYNNRTVWIQLNFHDPQTDADIPAGAVRAIVGPAHTLKFSDHLSELWGTTWNDAASKHGLSPDSRVIECATISVLPEFRTLDGHWAAKALCAAFGHLVLELGCDFGVQVQDVAGIRLLTTMLHLPFHVFADLPAVDFNGPVQPSITHIAEHHNLIRPSKDTGFRRLYLDRDQACRGGTVLPTIDLTENGPLALHQRLMASQSLLTGVR